MEEGVEKEEEEEEEEEYETLRRGRNLWEIVGAELEKKWQEEDAEDLDQIINDFLDGKAEAVSEAEPPVEQPEETASMPTPEPTPEPAKEDDIGLEVVQKT